MKKTKSDLAGFAMGIRLAGFPLVDEAGCSPIDFYQYAEFISFI